MTAVTDAKNQVIAPTGSHVNGKYQVKGTNHRTDEELILPTDSPIEVQMDQEFRVWYTEDLIGYTEADNAGKHCIHVILKYC